MIRESWTVLTDSREERYSVLCDPRRLRGLLSDDSCSLIRTRLSPVRSTSMTRLVSRLPRACRTITFQLLPGSGTLQMCRRLPNSIRRRLLTSLQRPRMLSVVGQVSPSSHTHLFSRLPTGMIHHLLLRVDPTRRRTATLLLNCPTSDTKQVVASRFIALQRRFATDRTVRQVQLITHDSRAVCALCIASSSHRLLNAFSLQSLIITPLSRPVRRVVAQRIISIRASASRRRTTHLVRHCSFLTLPIISDRRHLMNVIAVSSLVSIVRTRIARSVCATKKIRSANSSCFGAGL